ncbi:aldehyde dehydrogenase family protein [Streptomyces sp. NPDC127068]|uniref:aldehyde dehydrogenase family protein n=1 Tax=Streptomyces sp. NPDC127068 TaxID=3347127 RepID=UPI00365A262B
MSGQCVVTAASTSTVVSALALRALAYQAGVPSAVWQVLHAQDPVVVSALSEHCDASTRACCTPRTLQGSQTRAGTFIVRHDAHLPAAVRHALRCCFWAAGRPCTATPTLMVHARIHDEFMDRFTEAAARLPQHPLAHASAVFGALADAHQMEDVRDYVRQCAVLGGRVLHDGGQLPHVAPHMHGPVVIQSPTPELLPREVPPGPIAVVSGYRSWSDVLYRVREAGRHVTVHTTTSVGQLAPQFAGPPPRDLTLVRPWNRVPRRRPRASW